jgi:1-acyl-sn-glycerol-3-phosphate acyltransferase
MLFIDDEVARRVDRLEIPFNAFGVDPYGVSKKHVAIALSALEKLYKRYFRVESHGHERVPARGRAMLVGNHSGGVAIDGAMVIASMLLEKDPPRLAQGMAEKFINRIPFASTWANRTGQFTGLPEHAARLLEDERLLMVFPEGARGTAKLYKERYSLVQFGTGFMRLAMKTKTPIVPFAFIGGGDAFPTIVNSYTLGALVGAPYVPITAYLVPAPIPVPLAIEYGEPMTFAGTGNEDDEAIARNVDEVKRTIARLLDLGLARRG